MQGQMQPTQLPPALNLKRLAPKKKKKRNLDQLKLNKVLDLNK